MENLAASEAEGRRAARARMCVFMNLFNVVILTNGFLLAMSRKDKM